MRLLVSETYSDKPEERPPPSRGLKAPGNAIGSVRTKVVSLRAREGRAPPSSRRPPVPAPRPRHRHRYSPRRVALVLAGGGARGAYEVGVVRYILEELPRRLGREVPIDILSGTSVGAVNACHLAAYADEPRTRAVRLADEWRSLNLQRILRPAPLGLAGAMARLLGFRPSRPWAGATGGGIVDPSGLAQVLGGAIPFERIDRHIDSGRLLGVSVSATHVGTGRTALFVHHHDEHRPRWGSHPGMVRRRARLRLGHTLASAAIPFVFPAVDIDGDLYCDGGLKQNVPLSPARRLGADCMIVINPAAAPAGTRPPERRAREGAFPGPAFLLGKTLNALLLDPLDNDLTRLERINDILAAGTREYGPGFVAALNRQMGLDDESGLRPVQTVVVRASQSIGGVCRDFVRSPAFAGKGFVGRALGRLAHAEGSTEADLLSYLLFDGDFAAELMALGEADGRAHEGELCDLFEDVLMCA